MNDPDAPVGGMELRFEYANENRQMTIGLGGTGVAILTFLLIFLYGRFDSFGWGWLLFRATLAVVVLSIFFLGLAGTYFYILLEAVERGHAEPTAYLRKADATFVAGLGLLMLEPSLILVTLGIYDIGALAVGLWAVSLFVIGRERSRLGL